MKFQWYLFSQLEYLTATLLHFLSVLSLLSSTFPDNLSSFHSPLSTQCWKIFVYFQLERSWEKKSEPFNRKIFKLLSIGWLISIYFKNSSIEIINIVHFIKSFWIQFSYIVICFESLSVCLGPGLSLYTENHITRYIGLILAGRVTLAPGYLCFMYRTLDWYLGHYDCCYPIKYLTQERLGSDLSLVYKNITTKIL